MTISSPICLEAPITPALLMILPETLRDDGFDRLPLFHLIARPWPPNRSSLAHALFIFASPKIDSYRAPELLERVTTLVPQGLLPGSAVITGRNGVELVYVTLNLDKNCGRPLKSSAELETAFRTDPEFRVTSLLSAHTAIRQKFAGSPKLVRTALSLNTDSEYATVHAAEDEKKFTWWGPDQDIFVVIHGFDPEDIGVFLEFTEVALLAEYPGGIGAAASIK